MLFRDYRSTDFPQVEKLWIETGIYTIERGDTASIILRCNQSGGKFIIMEEKSTGLVSGTSWITWDGRRLFLHHFAIRPDIQGKGLGRLLALESLKFAQAKNAPMKLEVHQDNFPAVQLYKSLGFEVFDDYDVYMI